MIAPNPLLGVGFHSVGAMLAANCYAPQKYVRRWSWEIFWMTQAAWCWLLWPIIGALATIPQLGQVLSESPKRIMVLCFLMGMAYGVGGTAFNLSIRYIGFALTYAIAVGLSAILGTIVPAIMKGNVLEILGKTGSQWLVAGVLVGILGIALCGIAGHSKETDLRQKHVNAGGFSMLKGLLLSLVAGVLSAVYGIALATAGPIVEIAEKHGAGYWKGNVAYLFANTGAFLTVLVMTLALAVRNRSLGELVGTSTKAEQPSRGRLLGNYLLATMTGTLWYGQFFFYNLGHVRLGADCISWAVHMIMLVLFSNLLGVVFLEWKGCRLRTHLAIGTAIAVLVTAVLLLSYGNSLQSAAK
jgi:L-rhamnose-H+ transport protein